MNLQVRMLELKFPLHCLEALSIKKSEYYMIKSCLIVDLHTYLRVSALKLPQHVPGILQVWNYSVIQDHTQSFGSLNDASLLCVPSQQHLQGYKTCVRHLAWVSITINE